uniref:Polyprotein n=1 Tax=Aethomys rat picornavirus TaxID=3141854 RepID=A0AAU7E319_9VIRU
MVASSGLRSIALVERFVNLSDTRTTLFHKPLSRRITMAVLSNTILQAFQLLGKTGKVRVIWTCIGCDLLGYQMKARIVGGSTNDRYNTANINFGASVSKSETGNKPVDAQAGRDLTIINYYGTDYAMAKTDALQTMDPEKFTKPITALMGGPALKSPTVEECGYSDRVMQLTAGNSTITTQEAVDAIVAYAHWPVPSNGSGEAIDKLSTPGPAVDRFYTLDSVDWTTSFPGYFWRLPGALSDLGVFGQNCTYHYLMRAGFCVHLQLNASKFHQGCVMLVAIPECEMTTTSGLQDTGELLAEFYIRYPIHQMTIFPHQFVNLRTNNSATLILPYVNSVPAENAITHNYWTVCVLPIAPLQYNTGASTVVPMTISIAPMHAEFSGLRQPVPVRQGVPVFEIPGSGQFVTTIRNSGFPLYPEFQATHSHFIPGEVTNLVEVMQIDTFCRGPNGSANILLDVGQRTTTPLLTFDMDLNSEFFQTTYLARCCKWFTNYRGSIRLTFTFCGSAMATGKLLLSYTPPGGDAPTSRRDAMLATHMVWDLGLQSSVTFIVPWISQTQYRFPNTTGNIYNYAGYVTVWYQTSIVVPPGAPSTCAITIMAGACEDFQVRLPTDNAYYQGIGDTLGKIIEQRIETSLKSVDVPAVGNAMTTGDDLVAQTGDAPALTASETGASTTTSPETVMETRSVPVSFSARESCIENFFSRYAAVKGGTQDWGQINTGKTPFLLDLPLTFNDVSTQLAIKAKYHMFTYFRCAFDIVVVVENESFEYVTGNAGSGTTAANSYPVKFEMAFVPPGGPSLAQFNASAWDMPTLPKVFFTSNGVPASVRIPFMSVANAYRTFFDGFSTFSGGTYGNDPGNMIGTLYIRNFLNILQTGVESVRYRTHWKVFARPVNVHAWCPRPIVSLKSTSRALRSHTRVICVEDEDENQSHLLIGQGPWGTDVMNFSSDSEMEWEFVSSIIKSPPPQRYFQWLEKCPVYESDGALYHILPVAHNLGVANHHLLLGPVTVKMVRGPSTWTVEHMDLAKDLCILKFPDGSLDPIPCCDCKKPRNAWIMNAADKCNTIYVEETCFSERERFLEQDHVPAHWQTGCIRAQVSSGPGWCGSPMFCARGLCGFVTGGTFSTTLVTALAAVDQLHQMEVQPHAEGPQSYQVGQRTRHHRKRRKNAHRNWCATEQGPMDWIRQLGSAFGVSAASSAFTEAKNLVGKHLGETASTGVSNKITGWLIKAICATVLISRSENVAETAACVGVMIGVDLVNSSPFEWVKHQVFSLFGIKHQQGPTEWLKEFNVFCTTARGLDWIGREITRFVQWIQGFVNQMKPEYQDYMQCMKCFPDLMNSIDKFEKARGSFPLEDVKKVVHNMRLLKQMVDKYGCSDTQVVRQVMQYYEKVKDLEKTMTETRHEPVALLIKGGPGSGKSLATTIIGRAIAKYEGSGQVYCLPPDAKHFDGYCQQPVVIMDDVGQNPDGEDLKLFCQMVSSTEFIPPMAELQNKGKPFTSEYVLASSNCCELKPPTISTPAALKRRFYRDLTLNIKSDFSVNGKLDAAAALKKCEHMPKTPFFTHCCPLICGAAVTLQDHKLNDYTVQDVVDDMINEQRRRAACVDKLEALFQGPPCSVCTESVAEFTHAKVVVETDGWLQSEFDKEGCCLKTFEEQAAEKRISLKPLPREVADLLRAVPDERIIRYCAEQGWCLDPVNVTVTRQHVWTWIETLEVILLGLAMAVGVVGIIMSVYRLFAREQGPYAGPSTKKVAPPTLRKTVVAQGPNYQFEQRLFSTSLFDVETLSGHYSGLGLYDQWLLLPRHVQVDTKLKIEGVEFSILDSVELVNKDGPLELMVVKIDRPVKFRDIRKFFPDSFTRFDKCTLLVNNENFRQMFCPVGHATRYGRLNLSGSYVQNTCMYPFPTKCGQCGGVVTSNSKIIAMHIGGDGLNGYGAILTSKMFALLDQPQQPQGEIVSKKESAVKINVNAKTKLRPSVFHDVFEGTKEPAALHPHDKRLEVELDAAMFGKYKGNREVACPELDVAIAHYTSQLQTLLPANVTDPLPLEDVVYGIENLDGLDLNTSAGYPYNVKGIRKRDLIPERGEPLTKLTEALDLHGKYLLHMHCIIQR